MPIETDKDRLRLFLGIKSNPELALLHFVRNLETELDEKFRALKAEILAEAMAEIKSRAKELDPNIENMVAKVLKHVKGDQGDKGEQGDKPVAGIDYPIPKNGKDGHTPIKNKDYFDGNDGEQGLPGKSIVGPKGDKGDFVKGPKGDQGDPGSPDMPKDIKNKLERLKGEDRLSASAIKGLEEVAQKTILVGGDRGRRAWPRTVDLTSLVDGTEDTFPFGFQAKPGTIRVFVNGFRQREGTSGSYTVSSNNRQIVFNSGSIPQKVGGIADELIIDAEEDR